MPLLAHGQVEVNVMAKENPTIKPTGIDPSDLCQLLFEIVQFLVPTGGMREDMFSVAIVNKTGSSITGSRTS